MCGDQQVEAEHRQRHVDDAEDDAGLVEVNGEEAANVDDVVHVEHQRFVVEGRVGVGETSNAKLHKVDEFRQGEEEAHSSQDDPSEGIPQDDVEGAGDEDGDVDRVDVDGVVGRV